MILIDHSTLSQGAQRGLRWEGLRCYCFLHRVRYQIHVTKIIVYFKWMIKVKWLHWYKYGLHHSYFKLPNCITNEILFIFYFEELCKNRHFLSKATKPFLIFNIFTYSCLCLCREEETCLLHTINGTDMLYSWIRSPMWNQ